MNQILQQVARLVFCNGAYRLERAHEQQTARVSNTCDMCGGTRAHAPAKDNHIFLINAQYQIKIIKHILCVIKNVLFISFKNMFIIRLIRVRCFILHLRLTNKVTINNRLISTFFRNMRFLYFLTLTVSIPFLMFICIKTISWIFNCNDINFQKHSHVVKQFMTQYYVFCICMEVNQQLR